MRIFAKLGLCLAIASVSTVSSADIVFNGVTIPSGDITTISIDPVSGDLEINVANDWAVTRETAEPPPPPPPPPPPLPSDQLAVSLSASVAEINQWEEVTFTWQSAAAERCVTRLGTPEWQDVSIDPLDGGSVAIQITEFGEISFRIFCFDVAGEVVADQVTLSVTETAPPAPEPEVVDPPTVSCDNPDVSRGSIVEWSEMYQAANFPDTSRLGDTFSISRNSYVAVRFNTGDAVGTVSNRAVAVSGGIRNVAVSQCPGMFVTDIPDACKQAQGTGSVHRFSTDGSLPCNLEPNTEYFFNITYADVNDRLVDESSYCGSSNCTVKLETFLSID
jgi:hypothetical protein